jgi:hypothetical protein
MQVDWEFKAELLAGELRSAGFLLLVCALVIAHQADSVWGYIGAAYIALYGLVSMGAKIRT